MYDQLDQTIYMLSMFSYYNTGMLYTICRFISYAQSVFGA